MKNKRIPTPTIAEILREEFLEPFEITPYIPFAKSIFPFCKKLGIPKRQK